jgi:hypothetical protein
MSEQLKADKRKADHNLQHLLVSAIWSDESTALTDNVFNAQGINIYRRNLVANAHRALMVSFPTVFKLLDGDVGENLVTEFLRFSPPEQGDWSQWGFFFPQFLDSLAVAEHYPYLADCASLDWNVHLALSGSDQTLDQASLHLLSECEPENIYIKFNANVKLLKTVYPLTEIFHAHHHADDGYRKTSMLEAKTALANNPVNNLVMVCRPEFKPEVITIPGSEGEFTELLMAGISLGQALDAVSRDGKFSFEKWLISAMKHNLIYTFKEK